MQTFWNIIFWKTKTFFFIYSNYSTFRYCIISNLQSFDRKTVFWSFCIRCHSIATKIVNFGRKMQFCKIPSKDQRAFLDVWSQWNWANIFSFLKKVFFSRSLKLYAITINIISCFYGRYIEITWELFIKVIIFYLFS